MPSLKESIQQAADDARVSMALWAPGQRPSDFQPLPPRLWEKLRLKMQARLRESTGEEFAIVTFINPETGKDL